MKKQINLYEIGEWTIIEILIEDVFEYYVRETENAHDYFRYQFGAMSRFNESQLTVLVENDYFTHVE